ncbi:MAG: NAD-dependent epimerase/dehydratase family protein [Myxococcota bacterium]
MALIALTGATGFVGSHIAAALREAGYAVRGVVRNPARGAWLRARGVSLVQADLTDRDSLTAAFAGADAVVSNAALGSWSGTLPDYERVNVGGMANLLDAMDEAGAARLVHISTVAVYWTRLWRRMGEDSVLYGLRRRWLNPSDLTTDWRYALTKSRAEALMWERAADRATALRPGPVYGSRDPKLTRRYLAALDRRVALAPTVGVPQVHAGDVGAAVVGALRNPNTAGRAYNLAGPPVSLLSIMRTLRQIAGRGPWLVPIPLPVWVAYDTRAAARDLGFQARPLEAGLREAMATA